jgi:hypothetical protein
MIHLMELPNPDPTDKAKRPGERVRLLLAHTWFALG